MSDELQLAREVLERQWNFNGVIDLGYMSKTIPQLASAVIRQAEEIDQLSQHDRILSAIDVITAKEIATLCGALEMAREALEDIEFVEKAPGYCSWCDGHKTHAPDCPRQRALAAIEEALK